MNKKLKNIIIVALAASIVAMCALALVGCDSSRMWSHETAISDMAGYGQYTMRVKMTRVRESHTTYGPNLFKFSGDIEKLYGKIKDDEEFDIELHNGYITIEGESDDGVKLSFAIIPYDDENRYNFELINYSVVCTGLYNLFLPFTLVEGGVKKLNSVNGYKLGDQLQMSVKIGDLNEYYLSHGYETELDGNRLIVVNAHYPSDEDIEKYSRYFFETTNSTFTIEYDDEYTARVVLSHSVGIKDFFGEDGYLLEAKHEYIARKGNSVAMVCKIDYPTIQDYQNIDELHELYKQLKKDNPTYEIEYLNGLILLKKAVDEGKYRYWTITRAYGDESFGLQSMYNIYGMLRVIISDMSVDGMLAPTYLMSPNKDEDGFYEFVGNAENLKEFYAECGISLSETDVGYIAEFEKENKKYSCRIVIDGKRIKFEDLGILNE